MILIPGIYFKLFPSTQVVLAIQVFSNQEEHVIITFKWCGGSRGSNLDIIWVINNHVHWGWCKLWQ